jgi:hypothetical protein
MQTKSHTKYDKNDVVSKKNKKTKRRKNKQPNFIQERKHSKKNIVKTKPQNVKSNQFGGNMNSMNIPQESGNDDGYGIMVADIFSDPNVVNTFPRETTCDCVEGQFIPNFFKLTQLNYARTTRRELTFFLPCPTTEMFTFSHMIRYGDAFFKPDVGYSPSMMDGQWINKYVKWMLYNCISSLYVTGPPLLGETRRPRVLNLQTNEGDSDVTIRYIFDKYNWETLKILHTFPGVGLPSEGGGPFVKMCRDDLNTGLTDWPTETNTDKRIKECIIRVWTNFLTDAHGFDNYADQYAYLWWLAGALGHDDERNLIYPKVYGLVRNGIDNAVETKYLTTSRVQFMLYEFPFWRQIMGGNFGVPQFPVHGNGSNKPEGSLSTPSGAAMIVQLVRYFTLIQKNYSSVLPLIQETGGNRWKIILDKLSIPKNNGQINEIVSRIINTPEGSLVPIVAPLIVHFRDGHASCSSHHSAFFENEWLNTPYRYLTGTSIHYTTIWHEHRKGWFAGLFSGKKNENDDTIMPLYQWKKTFGRAFCLKSPSIEYPNGFVNVCPPRMMGKEGAMIIGRDGNFVLDDSLSSRQDEWGYGIDEYVGGWMFIDSRGLAGWQDDVEPYCKEIFDNTIYIQIMWFHHFLLIPSMLLDRLNIKQVWLSQGNQGGFPSQKALWDNYINPIVNEYDGEMHNRLVGDADLRGILSNGGRINEELYLPQILEPSIVAFFLKLGACQRLLFDTFFYIGRYSHFPNNRPTSWADVKTYMYTVSDELAGLHKMNLVEPVSLSKYIVNTSIHEDLFAFLVHLIPPIYAYFYTLFNNSELATNFSENQEFVPSADESTTYQLLNTFVSNVLIPRSDDATFVFFYKKLYNFYGCTKSVREGGPQRRYNTFSDYSADGETNPDPDCMGWDMRQWYNPGLNVQVGMTENQQSLTFTILP